MQINEPFVSMLSVYVRVKYAGRYATYAIVCLNAKEPHEIDVHAVPMYADVFNPLHCLPLIREINHSAIQSEACICKFLTNPALLICGRADNAHCRLDIA